MSRFKEILAEVARAQSPGDKEFVALHKVEKKQFVQYPETQFKGGTEKDHSKMAHPSNETGVESDVEKEKPLGESLEEVVEQNLQEISKKTLGSYIARATSDVRTHAGIHRMADMAAKYDSKTNDEKAHWNKISNKADDKAAKRQSGIVTAVKKLTKEEVDALSFDELVEHNLMEISKKTLGSYIKKATSEKDRAGKVIKKEFATIKTTDGVGPKAQKAFAKTQDASKVFHKRQRGIDAAKEKLEK